MKTVRRGQVRQHRRNGSLLTVQDRAPTGDDGLPRWWVTGPRWGAVGPADADMLAHPLTGHVFPVKLSLRDGEMVDSYSTWYASTLLTCPEIETLHGL